MSEIYVTFQSQNLSWRPRFRKRPSAGGVAGLKKRVTEAKFLVAAVLLSFSEDLPLKVSLPPRVLGEDLPTSSELKGSQKEIILAVDEK